MLSIKVPLTEEGFDEEKQEFVEPTYYTLELEHSLFTLSKWESFFEIPFFGTTEKTTEQLLWYIEVMVQSKNPPVGILQRLTQENLEEINAYIAKKMTATTIRAQPGGTKGVRETITAEIIYYWMVALQIPFECQYWHLNRLFTLVEVCNLKNAPAKKMSAAEAAQQQRELNAKRRAEMGTKG